MSNGNRRHYAALGGLAAALLLGAAVEPPSKPQSNPQAAPATAEADAGSGENVSAHDRESLAIDRAANRIAETANAISSDQRDYAFWQMILAIVGVAFTGVAAFFAYRATHWAKEAAKQAGISAKADNEALSEARAAAEDGRAEAMRQALRTKEQLSLLDETMQYTAKSAYAMSDTARETRHVATAMRQSAEASIEAAAATKRYADAVEAQLLVGERSYVFFLDAKKLAPGAGFAKLPQNTYRVTWRNFGKSPAIVTGVRLGLSQEDGGADPATMSRHDMPFGAVIGPGDSWARGQVVVTDKMIGELKEDARPIWLCGEISYRDLHGKAHRSWFCRFYVGLGFVLDDSCDPAFNGYD